MKNISVKKKITILLTMLMGFLACLLLGYMLVISSSVAERTATEQLLQTVRHNTEHLEVKDGRPEVGEAFDYYQNGVTTLIYSKKESLIAGQLPVSFTSVIGFENGVIRKADAGKMEYIILDMWIPSDWSDGVWLRGMIEAPDNKLLVKNLLMISLVALPVFMLLAALGSYHIARRSFRPLEAITATAEAINEAKDLSGRIGLPPGNDEFSRLAGDFDQMFERLERSFEAEKQFTADASHELRTPVSIIKGACEYAEKYDETPEDHQETISMIYRQADKMAKLISRLLSMTRMEQGTEKIRMERIELGSLAKEICKEEMWDLDQLEVEAQQDIFVNADTELLGRLLRNLVENAFKYGKANGHVWVRVTKDKEEAQLSVRDDGIGIPEAEQEKIWRRFYQVDTARSDGEGTGLGLSMVRQIAGIHDGYMTLDSKPGEGSIFTLHLPLG